VNRAQTVQRARIMRALRRYLINGLLIWVPVLVTVLVVRFILQLMDQTLLVLPRALRPDALLGLHIPGFGALLGLLIVLLTGLLVTNFIGQALVGIGEDLLERMAGFLRPLMLRPPPALGSKRPGDLLGLLREAGRAAGLSKRDVHDFYRVMTMSVGPARCTIQSSATSGPSLTITRSIKSLRGTFMNELATTKTCSP